MTRARSLATRSPLKPPTTPTNTAGSAAGDSAAARATARGPGGRFFGRLLGTLGHRGHDLADARAAVDMCHALLTERGDVAGVRLATDIMRRYQALNQDGRLLFFDALADQFSPSPRDVRSAIEAYTEEPSPSHLRGLQRAVEAPRQELFRRLNLAPGGTATLVDMRRQLMRTLDERPAHESVDADLAHLFRSWFNAGFLRLERIEWRTSAVILERLIQYEAVHQIQGWKDLRRRLEADRRCYAFFHPALADEPLIFIEIALTRGMSARVQPLLDPDAPVVDPKRANCAIFYSITNCQEGLRGVSFGNFLIKQVVTDLGRECPHVKTFATLSPVPGFRNWLEDRESKVKGPRKSAEVAALLETIDSLDAVSRERLAAPLREELTKLCAAYLLCAKLNHAPLDPVARFHLANGARLERLNWMADTSESGISRSLGFMANYVYRLADLERNHDLYARQYQVVASRTLARLVRP
jgi:malonyl-CoA decarboxylase